MIRERAGGGRVRHGARVAEVLREMEERIRSGRVLAGDRFPSTRSICRRHGVSYQTAHRLVSELADRGWLVKRRGSGTYVAGGGAGRREAVLVLHPRARREGSFGHRLRLELEAELARAGVPWRTLYARRAPRAGRNEYQVVWEAETGGLSGSGRPAYALLINQSPPAGLAATVMDAVGMDDFSGGRCAAQILERRHGRGGRHVVVAGPKGDGRSEARVAGFRSLLPEARVVWAGGWDRRHGAAVRDRVARGGTQGVFCANDRLASAFVGPGKAGRPAYSVVGFDDAPVAAELGITTVAIPWKELARAAVEVVRRRVRGDTRTAGRLILAPRPVERST